MSTTLNFNVTLLLGGQVRGEEPGLYLICFDTGSRGETPTTDAPLAVPPIDPVPR